MVSRGYDDLMSERDTGGAVVMEGKLLLPLVGSKMCGGVMPHGGAIQCRKLTLY